jgi:molecular chaperone GrpE
MSSDSKPTANDNAPGAQAPGHPAAPAEPQDAEFTESAPQGRHHDDVIAELRREVADLKDRVLRAHAEVENIRKRTDREKEDTAKYAITRFSRDIVAVADNFQRALGAVPAGAAEADPALKALIEGVTLTEREFHNVLERYGVKRIDPKDEAFNPHFHQAVMEMQRPDVPSGTVVQVFQAGYTIEDRVLRPAMVVVATGGFKPVTPVAGEPAAEPPGNGPSGQAGGGGQDGEPHKPAEPQGFGRRATPPGGGGSSQT